MDAVNAQSLEQAVQVLRDRYGESVPGGQEDGTVEMRRALQSGMGISEEQADALLKHLANTRRLIYVGPQDVPGSDVEPVVPLPRQQMGAGPLMLNEAHGLTTPMAGAILNENDERNSPGLLSVNEQGHWSIRGGDSADSDLYTQPRGPASQSYSEPGDDNSYAADLEAAGEQMDADARQRQ